MMRPRLLGRTAKSSAIICANKRGPEPGSLADAGNFLDMARLQVLAVEEEGIPLGNNPGVASVS
jgi:hypothetical protein